MASYTIQRALFFSLQKHMMPAAMSRGVRNDGSQLYMNPTYSEEKVIGL